MVYSITQVNQKEKKKMTEQERMLAGELYLAGDEALLKARRRARELTRTLSTLPVGAEEEQLRILRELLGSTGETLWIEPPFSCDYGKNIHVGENFYANFDCILLDVCPITLGDNVLLGPRVSIFAASHPLDAATRASGLECGRPVRVGNDVWIGGNTVINPGVTIGDDVIIGSGSVVTKDIPSGVIAAGNPCKVLRPITQEDRAPWQTAAKRYWEEHPGCC